LSASESGPSVLQLLRVANHSATLPDNRANNAGD
jgi:hypothetical protein